MKGDRSVFTGWLGLQARLSLSYGGMVLLALLLFLFFHDYKKREKFLVERNAHLEEQMRSARALHESVRQQIFERKTREKLLVEQNARLAERTRLSRDLHDSVKQQVFALAVQIELARSRLEQDHRAASEHLNEADELSYQIQQELTVLIDALHPTDVQVKGLRAALNQYVTNWGRQNKIAVALSLPEICQLPALIEETLWRVTQEALSNIARHSQASRVQIRLECAVDTVSLSIRDNGQGFDASSQTLTGFGLRSMHERVEHSGGTLQLQSTRGVGTRIVVQYPLAHRTSNVRLENEATP